MEEIWKKIIINGQNTFYSVSNLGHVRNDLKKTLIEGYINNKGYRMVHLRLRTDKLCSVHRLVMKAFKPCSLMDELQVNHIDGNKDNYNINNLEWCTGLENMRHSYLTDLQPRKMLPCYQYDLEGNFIQEFINANEAAKQLNMDYNSIWKCVKGEAYHYKKYQFKDYKKDKIPPFYNPNMKAVFVYTVNGTFVQKFQSQAEAAKAFGIADSTVSRLIKNQRPLKEFIFSRTPL